MLAAVTSAAKVIHASDEDGTSVNSTWKPAPVVGDFSVAACSEAPGCMYASTISDASVMQPLFSSTKLEKSCDVTGMSSDTTNSTGRYAAVKAVAARGDDAADGATVLSDPPHTAPSMDMASPLYMPVANTMPRASTFTVCTEVPTPAELPVPMYDRDSKPPSPDHRTSTAAGESNDHTVGHHATASPSRSIADSTLTVKMPDVWLAATPGQALPADMEALRT